MPNQKAGQHGSIVHSLPGMSVQICHSTFISPPLFKKNPIAVSHSRMNNFVLKESGPCVWAILGASQNATTRLQDQKNKISLLRALLFSSDACVPQQTSPPHSQAVSLFVCILRKKQMFSDNSPSKLLSKLFASTANPIKKTRRVNHSGESIRLNSLFLL